MINPEDIDPSELDFSMFHPTDHRLWRCTGYPGGKRTHIKYVWVFKWQPSLYFNTLCRVGKHKPAEWWSRKRGSYMACAYCGKE